MNKYYLWIIFSALSFSILNLVFRYSTNILFSDQFDLVSGLVSEKNLINIFLWRHGPHRQGIIFVVWGIIQSIVGIDARIPSWISVICVIVATYLAIKIIRILTRPSLTDIIIPVIFLSPKLYESLIGVSNPSHGPFPLFMIFLFILLLINQKVNHSNFLLGICIFLLTFSGFGLVVIPVVISLCFLQIIGLIKKTRNKIQIQPTSEDKNRIIYMLFSAFLSVVLFLNHYQLESTVECFSGKINLLPQFNYILNIFASFTGFIHSSTNASLVGIFIFAVILTTFIRSGYKIASHNRLPTHLLPSYYSVYIASGFTIVFTILTAYGRECLGVDSAYASRYLPYILPGIWASYVFIKLNFQFSKLHITHKKNLLVIFSVILFSFEIRGRADWEEGAKYWYLQKNNIILCSQGVPQNITKCVKSSEIPIYPDIQQLDELITKIYGSDR